MSHLIELAPDLYAASAPQRAGGLNMGTRMSVIRLSGRRLVLISPIKHTAELQSAVDDLGTVRFIVCPSKWHHLYAHTWRETNAQARLLAVPEIETRAKRLLVDETIWTRAPDDWEGLLQIQPMLGASFFNDLLFFHAPTGSLITADSLANFNEADGLTRLYLRACGALGKPSHTWLHRFAFRDRPAVRDSADRALQWDFDRIVVAHGDVLDSGGKSAFEKAFAWVR